MGIEWDCVTCGVLLKLGMCHRWRSRCILWLKQIKTPVPINFSTYAPIASTGRSGDKSKANERCFAILKALGEWMKREYVNLKPKSQIAKAMAYSIKRWDRLSLYATIGHLDINNNSIERCMKTLAVGRKVTCSSVHMTQPDVGKYYILYW